MLGNNWEDYYNTYRENSHRFTTPEDDARVISKIFYKLETVVEVSPTPLSTLVVGVGGSKAIRGYSKLFWENISSDKDLDTLVFLDIRNFDSEDKVAGKFFEKEALLVQADGTMLPFEDNSFNLVLTHCLFECLSDQQLNKIMGEIDRVTMREGLGIHTFADCNNSIERAIRRGMNKLNKRRFGIDFNYRMEKDIEELLDRNNFNLVDMGMVGSGFNECQNLTIGCVKGFHKSKRKSMKAPFIV
jgi:hypothetical protein